MTRRRFRPLVALVVPPVACAALLTGAAPAPAAPAGSRPAHRLAVQIDSAPVAPDGTTAGAVTDLVLTFAPDDPRVPGVGIRAGGTVTVTLPPQFTDTGTQPFGTFGTPGCAPPTVQACNTALILQGWPQSPIPPFPTVAWDPDARTVTATVTRDWLPDGTTAPGPKQLHLLLLGFRNPDHAGRYPMEVDIRPDPATDRRLTGTGQVRILPRTAPRVALTSIVNGAPPPPFPNSVHQSVPRGGTALPYGLYLWGRDGVPHTGARLIMITSHRGLLLDSTGRRIGRVRIRAPRAARAFSLTAPEPAASRPAFITGTPTALLLATFTPDPDVTGRYRITIALDGGNRLTLHVDAEDPPAVS